MSDFAKILLVIFLYMTVLLILSTGIMFAVVTLVRKRINVKRYESGLKKEE